jgi:ABC-2 type transport system ATP-binding protein
MANTWRTDHRSELSSMSDHRHWAIRTEHVGKRYDNGHWGLRDVSLELPFGSMVALLGANGAGKSTLIHLLCGALNPTTGTIVWNPEVSGPQIGWCSQRQSLDWYLTVRDNVLLGARLAKMDRTMSRQKTDEVLRFVELDGQATSFADELSGGQQQRLQIARALVAEPAVLLLDEPTAGLDVEAAERLADGLKARAANGAMVLVSSHDIGLLETRGDAVLLLADGEVVAFESRDSFLQRFAGDDVLEIQYEGTLTGECLATVEREVVRIVETIPLRLVIKREAPLIQLINLVESTVRIQDIRRERPGLREAFLTFAQQARSSRQQEKVD